MLHHKLGNADSHKSLKGRYVTGNTLNLDCWPHKTLLNKFPLFQVSKSVVICYGSHRRLVHHCYWYQGSLDSEERMLLKRKNPILPWQDMRAPKGAWCWGQSPLTPQIQLPIFGLWKLPDLALNSSTKIQLRDAQQLNQLKPRSPHL